MESSSLELSDPAGISGDASECLDEDRSTDRSDPSPRPPPQPPDGLVTPRLVGKDDHPMKSVDISPHGGSLTRRDFQIHLSNQFPWRSAPGDHFETPSWVLGVMLPFLKKVWKRPVIYDPFYCMGTVATHWRKMGVSCHHQKRDFNHVHLSEQLVCLPLVSCPPAAWIRRLLEHTLTRFKRWALLIPATHQFAIFDFAGSCQTLKIRKPVVFELKGGGEAQSGRAMMWITYGFELPADTLYTSNGMGYWTQGQRISYTRREIMDPKDGSVVEPVAIRVVDDQEFPSASSLAVGSLSDARISLSRLLDGRVSTPECCRGARAVQEFCRNILMSRVSDEFLPELFDALLEACQTERSHSFRRAALWSATVLMGRLDSAPRLSAILGTIVDLVRRHPTKKMIRGGRRSLELASRRSSHFRIHFALLTDSLRVDESSGVRALLRSIEVPDGSRSQRGPVIQAGVEVDKEPTVPTPSLVGCIQEFEDTPTAEKFEKIIQHSVAETSVKREVCMCLRYMTKTVARLDSFKDSSVPLWPALVSSVCSGIKDSSKQVTLAAFKCLCRCLPHIPRDERTKAISAFVSVCLQSLLEPEGTSIKSGVVKDRAISRACKNAFTAMMVHCPNTTSKAFVEQTNKLSRLGDKSSTHVYNTLRHWSAMSRAAGPGCSVTEAEWAELAEKVEKPICGKSVSQWAKGNVEWRQSLDAPGSGRNLRTQIRGGHTWNIDGLLKRLGDETFWPYLDKHGPDVVFLVETKCDMFGILDVEPLFVEKCHERGYVYLCFQWNLTATGYWNFGTGVLSRVMPSQVSFGIGCLDEEGRSITLCFKNLAFILQYAPLSAFKEVNVQRDQRREKWLQRNTQYYQEVVEKVGHSNVIVGGDLNGVHSLNDASLMGQDPTTFSGCKEWEIKYFQEFLRDHDLVDAALLFRHPSVKSDLTWHFRKRDRLIGRGLRLDYWLVPRGLLEETEAQVCVVHARTLREVDSSDHYPVSLELYHRSALPPKPHPESVDIEEEPTGNDDTDGGEGSARTTDTSVESDSDVQSMDPAVFEALSEAWTAEGDRDFGSGSEMSGDVEGEILSASLDALSMTDDDEATALHAKLLQDGSAPGRLHNIMPKFRCVLLGASGSVPCDVLGDTGATLSTLSGAMAQKIGARSVAMSSWNPSFRMANATLDRPSRLVKAVLQLPDGNQFSEYFWVMEDSVTDCIIGSLTCYLRHAIFDYTTMFLSIDCQEGRRSRFRFSAGLENRPLRAQELYSSETVLVQPGEHKPIAVRGGSALLGDWGTISRSPTFCCGLEVCRTTLEPRQGSNFIIVWNLTDHEVRVPRGRRVALFHRDSRLAYHFEQFDERRLMGEIRGRHISKDLAERMDFGVDELREARTPWRRTSTTDVTMVSSKDEGPVEGEVVDGQRCTGSSSSEGTNVPMAVQEVALHWNIDETTITTPTEPNQETIDGSKTAGMYSRPKPIIDIGARDGNSGVVIDSVPVNTFPHPLDLGKSDSDLTSVSSVVRDGLDAILRGVKEFVESVTPDKSLFGTRARVGGTHGDGLDVTGTTPVARTRAQVIPTTPPDPNTMTDDDHDDDETLTYITMEILVMWSKGSSVAPSRRLCDALSAACSRDGVFAGSAKEAKDSGGYGHDKGNILATDSDHSHIDPHHPYPRISCYQGKDVCHSCRSSPYHSLQARRCWACGSPFHLWAACPSRDEKLDSDVSIPDTGRQVKDLLRGFRKLRGKRKRGRTISGFFPAAASQFERSSADPDLSGLPSAIANDAYPADPIVVDKEFEPGGQLHGISLDESGCSTEQITLLKRVLFHFREIFTRRVNKPVTPAARRIQAGITFNNSNPSWKPARMLPTNPQARQEGMKLVLEQAKFGIIRPSTSPYTSPCLIIPKPNGTGLRFVVNYSGLNRNVELDGYALPRIDDTLSLFEGKQFFSTMDLQDGFWTVPIDEESSKYTAFLAPDGSVYEYTRLPQGLRSAPGAFTRFFDHVLRGLKWVVCVAYIDDVCVFGLDFDAHLAALDAVFSRIEEYGLSFKPSKCHFLTKKFHFLGYVVSKEGVRADETKIAAVRDMPIPRDKSALKSFVCLASYYRRLIKDFSQMALPLMELLKQDVILPRNADGSVKWSETQLAAIEALKLALVGDEVLAHPAWDLPFSLATDACTHGLGAVLSQKGRDGKERVISYASKSLTDGEKRYSVPELEFLAIVWAVRLFRMYLAPPFGRPFKIFTDSMAVKAILSQVSPPVRLVKWTMELSMYSYEVIHRKGNKNGNADALSRCPQRSACPYGVKIPSSGMFATPMSSATSCYFPPSDKEAWSVPELIALQKKDPSCRHLLDKAKGDNPEEFSIRKDGVLLYLDRIAVPRSLRAFFLHLFHGHPLSNHNGRNATIRQLASRYWWEGLSSDVRRWVRACSACARRKTPRPARAGFPSTMCSSRPFDTVAMDLVGKLTLSSEGYCYVLVMVDTFTRWPMFVPLKNKTPSEVATAIYRQLLCIHGTPKKILTDRGTEFVNAGLKSMCETWSIQKMTSSPRQKQGNGHVERAIRWLNSSMTTLQSKFGPQWDRYLDAAAFAYRVSVCDSTGFSPYELLYGRKPALPDHVAFNIDSQELPVFKTERDYHMWVSRTMLETYSLVRRQQQRLANINKARREKSSVPVVYQEGDMVFLWQPEQGGYNTATGTVVQETAPGKWTYRWTGPHVIQSKASDNTYNVTEWRTGLLRERCHVSTMAPFCPWSVDIPSTSPEVDRQLPWSQPSVKIAVGSLLAVATEGSGEFGVARLLQPDDGGDLRFQWLSNFHQVCGPRATYAPGWLRDDGKVYWGKRRDRNPPYTAVDSGTCVLGEHVLLHSFSLTRSGRLPVDVYRAILNVRKTWD